MIGGTNTYVTVLRRRVHGVSCSLDEVIVIVATAKRGRLARRPCRGHGRSVRRRDRGGDGWFLFVFLGDVFVLLGDGGVDACHEGIEGIYLGGWATSAKGSKSEDPGADLASYPLSGVPDEAASVCALSASWLWLTWNLSKRRRALREHEPR